jgi:hypothetical protein
MGNTGQVVSLVNAPAVCFDLVRLPAGRLAADVLATALAADPPALDRLETVARELDGDPMRGAARAAATSAAAAVPALGAALAAVAGPAPSGLPGTGRVDVATLVATPICRPATLLGLLHDDVLGWTRTRVGDVTVQRWTAAVPALCDALLAALAGPALAAPAAESLLEAYRRAALPVEPAELDPAGYGPNGFGPNGVAIRAALHAFAAAPADQLAALGRAHTHGSGWALAMHRACWAVHLAGRERAAAAAQFALARLVAGRSDRARLATDGVVAAASGVLHAESVRDLLDEDSRCRLLAPRENTHL